MTTKIGEYIDLYWPLDPSAYYVRGHVTPDEFRAALTKGLMLSPDDWPSDVKDDEIKHVYARWSIEKSDGCDMMLRVYALSGRRRFPVTVLNV